ncbi:unnamed protein product [Adineta steineri]|uniref:Uncharacterized protein n=1 Tax=Adineta steineri TaxID=433720 RepID=A0A814L2Y0_9BILA|nr:unnamed protein product [Adineta steineri]CAF1057823.1 unnamed protein product [Adineta steineri]
MNASYEPLNNEDQELFQRHEKGIDKSVRDAFPSIPADFKLKPVTIRKIVGCGMFYDIKVALPDNQYAKVSFHSGGHPMPRIDGVEHPKQEQHYNVDPTASSSKDE